ncbi:MAG: hypothetical protein Q3965_05845 [Rothia sp. (in: high G+C Gram-positive bacteria)]|nr:hypothetical protein [Rothia sp. (in: high G+C Gram-positive bacteria)]
MNVFKYTNVKILFGSWLALALLLFLRPSISPDSFLFYVYYGVSAICALLFAWQCMKGFFGMTRDARRGAEIREQQSKAENKENNS